MQNVVEAPAWTCVKCGIGFGGRKRRYCSARCRNAFNNAKMVGNRYVPVERSCPVCATAGVVGHGRIYCSDECRISALAKRRSGRVCTEHGCDRGVRARGLCTLHYRGARAVEGVMCSADGCSDGVHTGGMCPRHYSQERVAVRPSAGRAEESQRRRARQRAAFVAPVDRAKTFARDGFICQLCGEPIDMDAKMPAPLSPSIDHIVPLALGGTHEPDNVQASHFICNTRKGANRATQGVVAKSTGRAGRRV